MPVCYLGKIRKNKLYIICWIIPESDKVSYLTCSAQKTNSNTFANSVEHYNFAPPSIGRWYKITDKDWLVIKQENKTAI